MKTLTSSITLLSIVLTLGCSSYTTRHDKTKKGAAIGGAAGAAGAVIKGEREADEILAGAAIGAAAYGFTSIFGSGAAGPLVLSMVAILVGFGVFIRRQMRGEPVPIV